MGDPEKGTLVGGGPAGTTGAGGARAAGGRTAGAAFGGRTGGAAFGGAAEVERIGAVAVFRTSTIFAGLWSGAHVIWQTPAIVKRCSVPPVS